MSDDGVAQGPLTSSRPVGGGAGARSVDREGAFVVVSELAVGVAGVGALEEAFRRRLGEVDDWPGFRDLEVWRDERQEGRYLMVSWWDDRETWTAYMRSESHDRSHARIPTEPERPRPVELTRYRVVAT